MDGAGVSDKERSLETSGSQSERGPDMKPRSSDRVGWPRSARQNRERIEPKSDLAILGPGARSRDQVAEAKRLISAIGAKIEFEIRPCVETHPVESFVKGGGIETSEAEPVGADSAGRHDLQAVRSISQIVERLGIGLVGAGMIESRNDPPSAGGPNRPGAFRWRIDGFDPNAIRCLGYERVKARAFEGSFSGPAPIGFSVGGKKVCDHAQCRLTLDELGKSRNRCRDFAYNLITCVFARVAKNLLTDRLDLLHVEPQA
jgi:hypothetical protein